MNSMMNQMVGGPMRPRRVVKPVMPPMIPRQPPGVMPGVGGAGFPGGPQIYPMGGGVPGAGRGGMMDVPGFPVIRKAGVRR